MKKDPEESVNGSASAIEIRSARKTFDGVVAVDNLSLEVRKGEMFALVGPDGAG